MFYQPTLTEEESIVNQICMLCSSSDIGYYSPGQAGRVANCVAAFCMDNYPCMDIIHEGGILYLIVHKFADNRWKRKFSVWQEKTT